MGRRRFSGAVVILAFLLSVAPGIRAQQPDQKEAALRAHLGVPETVAFRIPVQRSLPSRNPLKVALAFGLDVEVFNNFVKWAQDDWNNKGDARKYGAVELVDNIVDADVVLARFLDRNQSAGASTSARVFGNNQVAVGGAETGGLVPLHAFILKKTDSGYDVLGGYEATATVDGSGGSGRTLWDEFKKLMKQRQPQ